MSTREAMVDEQLRRRGILDQRVLDAMATVPRDAFLPEQLRDQAYEDHPVAIGGGQTMSQPFIVAYMTEMLRVDEGHRVLDVGTGSGYHAAVVSTLARDVFSIEIDAGLAADAAERLAMLGYRNVHVRQGDGTTGWRDAAPFDRIQAAAAAPDVPEGLVDQLAEGGRMIIPIGPESGPQWLMLVERSGGVVSSRPLIPVQFVPFRSPGA